MLRVEPGHRQARENLAGMLAESGRMDEAAAIYRQAIVAAPRDADLHVLLAQTLMALGRDDEARAELEAALGIQPEHPQAKGLVAALAKQN